MLAAGVGAAVEVQPELGDLVPEAPLEVLDEACRRLFVSATAKLQCGSPVQPIAFERSRFASTGKPISPSAARRVCDVGDAGEDEVLLAGDAGVPALRCSEVRDREHLVARDQAQVDRHAERAQAGVVLGLAPMWSAGSWSSGSSV